MPLFKEFKEFAVKGNMIDMAIGIIIGTAFKKVIESIVQDLLMPGLGYITGKTDFSKLELVLKTPEVDAAGKVIDSGVIISYGNLINQLTDFLIIAFTIFMVVKFINILKRKGEDEKETSVPTPKDIQLLSQIDKSLKELNKKMEVKK